MQYRMVSIAIDRFGGHYADLDFAPALRDRLTEVFAERFGYAVDPRSRSSALTAAQVGELVHGHLTDRPRDDVLIVHVLSHGDERNDAIRVVGADGRASSRTSLDGWLQDASPDDEREEVRGDGDAPARGPWTLFLVDVCGAGQAARQAFQAKIDDERRRAWVVAGSLPADDAFNGHFTEALINVLAAPGRLDALYSEPYIPLALVARAVRIEVTRLARERDLYGQLVVATRVDLAATFSVPFFPNPHHRPSVLDRLPGVPAELREIAAAVDALVDPWHFASRAAGGTTGSDRLPPGCFRGRGPQLERIKEWTTGDEPLLVVTGSPGAGKSAILGMVVCASHPALSRPTRELWWGRRSEVPPVFEDLVAVHARERDLAAILRSLARQLGLPRRDREWSLDTMVGALAGLGRAPVIVVDALDEAVDPAGVAAALLALAEARPRGAPVCRLLAGTRSGRLWPAFDGLCERARRAGALLDLDEVPRDGELRADLEDYVDDLLRAHEEYDRFPMSRARAALAASAAATLAAPHPDDGRPRWGEFLVAGIFVNHIVRGPALADPEDAARVGRDVPRTLPGVLELDLASQASTSLSRAVLTCVAHAFGAGMPLSVITACCGAFMPGGEAAPTAEQVKAALDEARFYLRREMESDGSTLYRLFHQALADDLRGRAAEAAPSARSAILDTLRNRPEFLDLEGRWAHGLTPPYILRHAIDHAVAAGRVDELLEPWFLLHADPASLGAQLSHAVSQRARRVVDIYRTSRYRHQHASTAERRDLLALDAVRHGDLPFAEAMAGLDGAPAMAWRPRWATGGQAAPTLSHVLRGHAAGVTGVVCTRTGEGLPVAVTAGDDETVCVWNLETGSLQTSMAAPGGETLALGHLRSTAGRTLVIAGGRRGSFVCDLADPRVRHRLDRSGPVTAVAGTVLADGRGVAVTGTAEGSVTVWDLDAGGRTDLPVPDGLGQVSAITCTRLADGTDVAVIGTATGAAHVWDLARGERLHRLPAHDGWIGAVACYRTSAGTDMAAITGAGASVTLSSLPDGRTRHQLRHGRRQQEANWTGVPAVHELADGPTVLVVPGSDGMVTVWDVETRELRLTLVGHGAWTGTAACARLADGTDVAVSAGGDGTALVWSLADGRPLLGLSGHANSVTAAACTALANGAVVAVTAGLDGTVRVWDLAASPADTPPGHAGPVTSLAVAATPGAPETVVSTGRDGSIGVRRVADGHCVLSVDHRRALTAGALVGSRLHAADHSGRLRAWDLAEPVGAAPRVPDPPGPVAGLVACGSHLLVTVPSEGSGVFVSNGGAYTQMADQPHRLSALSAARLQDGTHVLLTADEGNVIRIWEVPSGALQHAFYSPCPVTALTLTAVSALGDTLLAGGADGVVRVWKAASNESPRVALTGHRGAVTCLACTPPWDGPELVASGGADATVRIWDLRTAGLLQTICLPEAPVSLAFGSGGELLVAFGWEVAGFLRSP